MTAKFQPKCVVCGAIIPQGRVEALGSSVTTCVNHSQTAKKTAADVDIAASNGEQQPPGSGDRNSLGKAT